MPVEDIPAHIVGPDRLAWLIGQVTNRSAMVSQQLRFGMMRLAENEIPDEDLANMSLEELQAAAAPYIARIAREEVREAISEAIGSAVRTDWEAAPYRRYAWISGTFDDEPEAWMRRSAGFDMTTKLTSQVTTQEELPRVLDELARASIQTSAISFLVSALEGSHDFGDSLGRTIRQALGRFTVNADGSWTDLP